MVPVSISGVCRKLINCRAGLSIAVETWKCQVLIFMSKYKAHTPKDTHPAVIFAAKRLPLAVRLLYDFFSVRCFSARLTKTI
jgi:hypothetical protein